MKKPPAITDEIAKVAWNATKMYWKEFMIPPVLVFGGIGLLSTLFLRQWVLVLLLYVAGLIFGLVFYGAIVKWCAEIHQGKQKIDVQAGLMYGWTRAGGVFGTAILTGIKVFLWSLLLVIPGIYKGILYSQSVKISILEKISGNEANRRSEAMITQAGFLRTLGNMLSVSLVTLVLMYVAMALIFLIVFGISFLGAKSIGALFAISSLGGVLGTVGGLIAGTFLAVFFNFQYLFYRDEHSI